MSEPDDIGLEGLEAILAAPPARLLDALAEGDEGEAALRRQQLEALASLALALPVEPAPAALRQRLLTSLTGDETQQVATPRAAAAPPAHPTPAALAPGLPAAGAAPPPPLRELPGERPATPPPAPRAARPIPPPAARIPPPRRTSRGAWALALAAGLAAIVLGGAAAYLWRELATTRERLAESERERAELAAEVAAAEARQESGVEAQAELGAMRDQLRLVTAAGTELCALRPPSARPVAPEAKGLLWVAEDHQHWYLRADGLTPPGQGRVYQLWFLVGDRPVSAGTFEMEGDEAVLTSPTMPVGTTAAMVTVEARGAIGERPSGPVVLHGKDFVKL